MHRRYAHPVLQLQRTAGLQDAQRMLHFWGRMTTAEQQSHHRRYKDIRAVIVNRITSEGSATRRTKLAPFIQRLANADSGVP
jgi:hypothetical protein